MKFGGNSKYGRQIVNWIAIIWESSFSKSAYLLYKIIFESGVIWIAYGFPLLYHKYQILILASFLELFCICSNKSAQPIYEAFIFWWSFKRRKESIISDILNYMGQNNSEFGTGEWLSVLTYLINSEKYIDLNLKCQCKNT